MRTNMLHSNLLGRLGNGLLKFVVFVVMVCNVSGAFATTYSEDKTYSEPITIFPTGDVITINPGVTLTINSEVTIMGNLINNGGTIIVGEGGVLTVTGNVTNTSAYSTTEYTTESSINSTSYSPKEKPDWPTGSSYPKTRTRTVTTTTTTTETPVFKVGSIEISNGGSITINGNFTNSSTLSILTTNSERISQLTVQGSVVNNGRETKENRKRVTVIATTKTQSQTRTSWKESSIGNWVDVSSTPPSDPNISAGATVSSTTSGTINLSNGYLTVNNLVLNDGSIINYNTGVNGLTTTVNEKEVVIESTIVVKNNATQNSGADINLASGAKGYLIVQGTYTDNTTMQNTTYHPWYLEETKEDRSFFISYQVVTDIDFVTETGFSFNVAKYNNETMSTEVNNWLLNIASYFDLGGALTNDQIRARISEIQNQLETSGTVNKTALDNLITQVSTLLPIELVSFKATATNNGFVFNWVTASEENNDYFTLEYSTDGVDFNEIDYVHGAGTTSETSEYEYRWDEAPEFEVVYFRLKQTDYNGEYSYSDVIVASRKKSSGANGTFRYGPLNLQIQDGELRYIQK